jgi:hypothetical protein
MLGMPQKKQRSPEEIRSAIEERRRTIHSWGLSADDFEFIIAENAHVYSPFSGFVAEYNLKRMHLSDPEIMDLSRPSGYNKDEKGDFSFTYRGQPIRLEVKSLDGPRVNDLGGDRWEGTFQCNASDARKVTLPNGHTVATNCIVAGGWDVLAVNLYSFGGSWRFAFARQQDLPRASDKYAAKDRAYLLASSMKIALPLAAPYTENLPALLDAIVKERQKSGR